MSDKKDNPSDHAHSDYTAVWMAVILITMAVVFLAVMLLVSVNHRLDQHRDLLCETHGLLMEDCDNWSGADPSALERRILELEQALEETK